MKKRKFSLLLNIATIALCVCAIAIGVYSAKKASLTVSGSIGFTAHDCIVEISGTYSAYTSATAETRTSTTLTTTTVGGKTSSDYAKSLPITSTLYFSDMATDGHGDEIVFNLTITNKSDFKITVKAPAPTLKNASGQDISGVTCTSSEEKFTLEAKDQTGASKTITLTYKLEGIDNATNITDGKFSITLNFEKWQQFYTDSVTELFTDDTSNPTWNEVTTTKLCTTMGHSIVGTGGGTDGETEIPIQWYAFAVQGVDTGKGYVYGNTWYANGSTIGSESDRWYSLNGINFNDNLEMVIGSNTVSSKDKTFWFIQQYVTSGGYYIGNTEDTYRSGVQFDSTNNNYTESDIYTSLTTETDGTYLSSTGIKDDGLYASVATRNVNESYKVAFLDSSYTSTEKDSDNKYTYTSTFSSKLWLISASELGLITNKDTDITKTGENYGTQTAGIGNQDLSKSWETCTAIWWLRSPHSGYNYLARAVGDDGSFVYDPVSNDSGVRAAFQISIPA